MVHIWQNVEGSVIPDWLQGGGTGESGGVLIIITPSGPMRVMPGGWIKKDGNGDLWPAIRFKSIDA